MRTNPPAQNGGEPTMQNMDRKMDHAADQAHDKIDQASNAVRPAIDKLAGRAHNAVDSLGAKGEEWLQAEQEMMGEVQAYVRAHPLQAVGMAIAGGFLLSRIIGSR